MSSLTFHFQVFVPEPIKRAVEALRGCKLDFGPHARKRWREKFGVMAKPLTLPHTAQHLEITLKPDLTKGPTIDKVLFRFDADAHTDVVLSLVPSTGFVCSVWRVPKWFGLNTGRPTDPRKYLTREQYQQKLGGKHAA